MVLRGPEWSCHKRRTSVKVTLHKVNTYISGLGMPSKNGKTYASKQMFVMYEDFYFATMFIFEALFSVVKKGGRIRINSKFRGCLYVLKLLYF